MPLTCPVLFMYGMISTCAASNLPRNCVAVGCPVSARVDGAEECARTLRASWDAGGQGAVVAVPPPTDLEGAEEMTRRAVAEMHDVSGPDVTPRLLARVAELSGGRSLDVNVDLVVNNARVAAQVVRAYLA